MTKYKRRSQIAEMLRERGEVKVSELSEFFQVTGKTVREDLEEMEEDGILTRVHGGAVPRSARPGHEAAPASAASGFDPVAKAKAEIAGKALRFIEPDDIIALDGGSTTLEIARRLDNAPLTVVTNDLHIIGELIPKERIDLVVPGGYRNRNLLAGTEAISFIRKLNIRKAFLSTIGIHADFGMTIYVGELLEQKRAWVECAKETYCVADHTKFDKCALKTFATLDEVGTIITDGGLSEDIAAKYAAAGVKIYK